MCSTCQQDMPCPTCPAEMPIWDEVKGCVQCTQSSQCGKVFARNVQKTTLAQRKRDVVQKTQIAQIHKSVYQHTFVDARKITTA